MKKIIKTVSILCLISTLSCSKDDEEIIAPQTPYLTGYSYSYANEELNLNYNATNQLTSFETQDPSSGTFRKVNNEIIKNSSGALISVGVATFTYNAMNQIVEINDGTGNGVTQLQYDAQGRFINQNTTYFSGVINEVKNLTYDASNRISKVVVHITSASSQAYYKYDITYNTQNNINTIIFSNSNDGITYEVVEIMNYTYDDKANPLKTVSNNLGFGNFYIAPSNAFYLFRTASFNFIAAYNLNWISNNNVTFIETIYATGGGNNTSYEYTYNEYGNPTKVVITDDEDGTYSQNYFYTNK